MKILALPRDANPYQDLLYSQLRQRGVRVRYLGRTTPSQSVSLLLLPLELAAGRLTGARLVHLHWVFAFSFPGGARSPALRRLSQAWFGVWLRTIRLLGLRLVWTAHNALPQSPVFADDVSARRALVRASSLVIAHSPATFRELAALGAVPRRSAVIPHGPFPPASSAGPLRPPGSGPGPRRFLFFGQVHEYKGVDDLLSAFLALPADIPARLTVVGKCPDPELRSRLHAMARGHEDRVALRLEWIPEPEVSDLLSEADVVVLPFRRITTSGSAVLALSHGRPLVIPGLTALADLPAGAVARYDGTVPALTRTLTRLAAADSSALLQMSAAATSFSSQTSWQDIASRTIAEMNAALGRPPSIPGSRAGRKPAKTRS